MDWSQLDALSQRFGESFYLFHESALVANVQELRSAMEQVVPAVALAYSYKTNHTPAVCRVVRDLGLLAEVSSPMEWWLAGELEVPGDRIVLDGPAKTAATVASALVAGALVNLESERDVAATLATVRAHPGTAMRVALRVGIPTSVDPHPRLGFDPAGSVLDEACSVLRAAGIDPIGVHCHSGDSSLAGLAARARMLVEVADRLMPGGPAVLDLGGSLFGRLPLGHDPLSGPAPSFADYAAALEPVLSPALERWARPTQVLIEPGTSLVSDAFSLVARVLDMRLVGGRWVAVIAASVLDTSPNTRRVGFPVRTFSAGGAPRATHAQTVDIGGLTPMWGDYVAFDVPGPLSPGDFVAIGNVGAYSVTFRPPFIQPAPAIVAIDDGGVSVVRDPQAFEDLFRGFH